MRRWLLFAALIVSSLTVPAVSHAQIMNGDFEIGGADWTPGVPAGWSVAFPDSGGNPDGFAQITMFGDSEGRGCVNQGFKCGEQGGRTRCEMAIDYRLDHLKGNNNTTGRVVVRIDGIDVFTSPLVAPEGWQHITFDIPCGFHTIGLCLEADAGENAWSAGFDNVTSDCMTPVPVAPKTWSSLKTLYR